MGREQRATKTMQSVNGHAIQPRPEWAPVEVSMEPEDFLAIQDAIETRDRAMRQAEIAAQEAKLAALRAHDECEVVVAKIRRKYPSFSSRVNYTPDEPRHTWVPAPPQQPVGMASKPQ